MSKPLLKLRGLSGYKDMYVMSLKTASEYNTLLGSKVTGMYMYIYNYAVKKEGLHKK